MGNKQSTGTPPLQISSKSSVVPVNHKLYSEILSNNIPNAPPNTPSNTPSTLPTIFGYTNTQSSYRVLSYNVEWGFLKLPSNIQSDSCGHPIPQTDEAQQNHLTLISKNIGLLKPDICFLQEMGSLDAVEFIANTLYLMFNIRYKCYYSNQSDPGNQGVGLLIIDSIIDKCEVNTIPNFKLNRGLGIKFKTETNSYKLVGVHLKSLYDKKIQKDEAEQEEQIKAVLDWVQDEDNVIICGDFNNVPTSDPIKLIKDNNYISAINSDKYIPNIIGNTYTEFHGSNGRESGSTIDYIFTSPSIDLVSSHIVDIQREAVNQDPTLRGETSDHIPVLAIVNLN